MTWSSPLTVLLAVIVLALGLNVLMDREQLKTDRILGDRIDLVNARVDAMEGECP